jgi:transcriptional regulator with XRE-family HTH domain
MTKAKKQTGTPPAHARQEKDAARADELFRFALSNRIVRARERLGLSQAKLAEAANLSRTVLNGYEKGNTTPGARQIEKLCTALNISPSELIYGSDAAAIGQGTPAPYRKDASMEEIIYALALFCPLAPSERHAVTTVLRGLFVDKHGADSLKKLGLLAPGIASIITPDIAATLEKQLGDKPLSPQLKTAFRALNEPAPKSLWETPGSKPAKKRR